VHVPRWVLATLVALLVVAITALAFMLGRESARPATPAAAPTFTYRETAPATPLTPATATPLPAAAGPVPPPRAPAPTLQPPAAAPRPAASAAAPAPPPADLPYLAEVAAYFHEIDNIHPGEMAGDPNQFAQEILNNAMSGDLSGFDRLIQQSERSQSRLRSLQPPPPCQQYHRTAVALTSESLTILRDMREALRQSHADNFSAISARATQMQVRAQTLQSQEIELKRRYGIVR